MQTFIIKPIDDGAVERMRAKLVAQGLSVNLHVVGNGNIDYYIEGHGVSAIAKYSSITEEGRPIDGTLLVSVQHKPFYLPLDVIQSGIQEAVDEEQEEKTELEVGLPLQNLPIDQELNNKSSIEDQIAKITAEKEFK